MTNIAKIKKFLKKKRKKLTDGGSLSVLWDKKQCPSFVRSLREGDKLLQI